MFDPDVAAITVLAPMVLVGAFVVALSRGRRLEAALVFAVGALALTTFLELLP